MFYRKIIRSPEIRNTRWYPERALLLNLSIINLFKFLNIFQLTQVIHFFRYARYETTDQEFGGYTSLDENMDLLLPQIVITSTDETLVGERKNIATPTSEYGSVVASD